MKYSKNENKKKNSFIKLVLSFFVGISNGFFGGGGGMICVPILEKFYKLENKRSHASTIVIMFLLSIFSSVVYIISCPINYFDLGMISIGVIIGGTLGAFLLKFLNPKIIRIIFALAMLIASFKLVL